MDGDTFDSLLPITTLLPGAAIGWFVKRSETRRTEAMEAGDILAELPNHVWRRMEDEDSWMHLEVFLARLRIRLRAAGVPNLIVKELHNAAVEHWHGCHQINTDDGWVMAADSEDVEVLNQAVDDAQLWLFGRVNWWQRHEAKQRHPIKRQSELILPEIPIA